ncbi:MAG: TonB-dependent receptor plug domain-containing protein [Prolixibacteraceae bacterium]
MNWKTVVILSLLVFLVEASSARANKKHKKIAISGYVTDVNRNPLQGISIISDGVSSNVYTNRKGFYKIRIEPEAKTLMAFEPNHGGVEVELDGHSKINFVLLADSSHHQYISPEEVKLYDYGYSKIRKMDRTSSTVLIDEKHMDNNSYKNVFEMIRGKAGAGGISSNSLYIVDGQEALNVDDISPVLIESITILNGPERAIYGIRGARGVVLITLKK